MTHYDVLGIEKTATPAEIKKAYKRMAKKHHPDRGGDAQQMVLVNKAYDTLMDPAKREHYDLTGEEKPLTALDIEARNSILQMFGQLLTAGKINIPARATSIAKQALAKINAELAEHKRKYEELQKRRDEVTCTAEENLWARLIDATMESARGSIALIERKREITNRVIEMLAAYRSGVVDNIYAPVGSAGLAAEIFREAVRQAESFRR